MSLPVEKRRQWIKSRREQRKLTKYARLRRQVLRYLVLLSMLSIGVFLFRSIHSYFYENKAGLIIEGNLVASNKQIFDTFKSKITNTPIFLLNPNELENKIAGLSAVKCAFVRRYVLPSPLLKIEILEEFPWATVYTLDSSSTSFNTRSQAAMTSLPAKETAQPKAQFVIAESGKLISIAQFPNVYQPALKIYTENTAQFRLNQPDIQQWANCLSYINKETECPAIALDMREPHNIKVETSKFTLILGNPDRGLTKRLNRLPSILEVLANQHKEPIYINLALNSNIPVKLAKKSTAGETKLSRL